MTRARLLAIAIGLLLAVAGCSNSSHPVTEAPAAASAKPTTFVTIGSSATEGDGVRDRLRQAWPYLVFNEAFPSSVSLVNAAVDGATVANAQSEQLPVAQQVKPAVVAILLGADDLDQRTPIDRFSTDLRSLIAGLRAAGTREILLADIPRAFGAGASGYNAVIRNVARSTDSKLVELEDAAVALTATRGLSDQPDAASQAVIAAAFERVLKPTP